MERVVQLMLLLRVSHRIRCVMGVDAAAHSVSLRRRGAQGLQRPCGAQLEDCEPCGAPALVRLNFDRGRRVSASVWKVGSLPTRAVAGRRQSTTRYASVGCRFGGSGRLQEDGGQASVSLSNDSKGVAHWQIVRLLASGCRASRVRFDVGPCSGRRRACFLHGPMSLMRN
jgi:hypothetical protein